MRPLFLALALAASPVVAQQPRRAAAVPALDEYVARAVRAWEVPGLALAVVKGDSVVFLEGYGVRERGRPGRVDGHTLFAVGSTTKAMTAAALGILAEEGKLRWDDPVADRLPWFRVADPYITRELTVRDLLTHRAGLGNADLLWAGSDYSTRQILERMRHARPAYSLRSSFIYQNIMYAAAGEVVAQASGMPWADFVRTRLFEPLGMRRTLPTAAALARQENVATPHLRIDDTIRVIANRSVDAIPAAGAVWSSAHDMARWIRFVLDSGRADGRAGGRALLKPATVGELLSPQALVPAPQFYPTARLTRPHFTAYGLGWFLLDYDGRAVAMHTGSIDGMVAIVGLVPDERLGVVVLANLDHAELRHALMYRVFDLYGPRGVGRDWSREMLALYRGLGAAGDSAERAEVSKRVAGTRPSLAPARYAGVYRDSLYGDVVVSAEGERLRVRFGPGFVAPLEHWHYDTFRATWEDRRSGRSLLTFGLDAAGAPATLRVNGWDAEFRRLDDRASR